MSVRAKIRPHASIHRHEGTHTHTHTQTFAALLSVVEIPSWAIATYNFPRVVVACAFDVAAATVGVT